MALESELRAYEFIKLISTGVGKVGEHYFNGVGPIGTYEEHKLAFELLNYIGHKYGSGFYIPYGPNYDFVRTAVNYGSLFRYERDLGATNDMFAEEPDVNFKKINDKIT